jgi:hypothetical protein
VNRLWGKNTKQSGPNIKQSVNKIYLFKDNFRRFLREKCDLNSGRTLQEFFLYKRRNIAQSKANPTTLCYNASAVKIWYDDDILNDYISKD